MGLVPFWILLANSGGAAEGSEIEFRHTRRCPRGEVLPPRQSLFLLQGEGVNIGASHVAEHQRRVYGIQRRPPTVHPARHSPQSGHRSGNLRLLTRIERVLSVNDTQLVSLEIVEAARDSLVIGQA